MTALPTPATHPATLRYRVGLFTVVIIGSACLLLATLMQPGTGMNPDLVARMHYIDTHRLTWQLGWLNWTASSFALLTFCILLVRYLPPHRLRRPAVLLVALGVLPDLYAQYLLIHSLPNLVTEPQHFLHVEQRANFATGVLANGLYCAGGLLLNVLLLRNTRLPPRLIQFGLPAWLFGFGISAAVLIERIDYAAGFTAIAMTWSLLWMFLMSRKVFRTMTPLAV